MLDLGTEPSHSGYTVRRRFCPALGFHLIHVGEDAFTSSRTGSGYLNLMAQPDDR